MKYRRFIVALAALSLSACATEDLYKPAPGQKMHITRQTLNGFKEYQTRIGSTHQGAFAVSSEGGAYSYWYCDHPRCYDSGAFALKAVKDCARYGEKCYLFARENDIKVDYDVVP